MTHGDIQDVDLFLSTPSARRTTTYFYNSSCNVQLFLSTPSARRATDHADQTQPAGDISIHALREEGDLSLESAPRSL